MLSRTGQSSHADPCVLAFTLLCCTPEGPLVLPVGVGLCQHAGSTLESDVLTCTGPSIFDTSV